MIGGGIAYGKLGSKEAKVLSDAARAYDDAVRLTKQVDVPERSKVLERYYYEPQEDVIVDRLTGKKNEHGVDPDAIDDLVGDCQ